MLFLFVCLYVAIAPSSVLSETADLCLLSNTARQTRYRNNLVLITSLPGQYAKSLIEKAKVGDTADVDTLREKGPTLGASGQLNFASRASLQRIRNFPLYIYHENSLDTRMGRSTFQASELSVEMCKVTMIDLFEKYPWALPLVTKQTSAISKFHHIWGGTSLKLIPQSAGLFRKVLSWYDAVHCVTDGTLVMWMDTDTYIHVRPDRTLIDWLVQYDVSILPMFSDASSARFCTGNWKSFAKLSFTEKVKCKVCADTGIVVFRASQKVRSLLEEIVQWYRGTALSYAKKCQRVLKVDTKSASYANCASPWGKKCNPLQSLNDISVLGHHLYVHHKNISLGFMGTGCVDQWSSSVSEPWHGNAKYYSRLERISGAVCPLKSSGISLTADNSSNIAPFPILRYVSHFWGSWSGLAQRRADWDTSAGPKVKTKKLLKLDS